MLTTNLITLIVPLALVLLFLLLYSTPFRGWGNIFFYGVSVQHIINWCLATWWRSQALTTKEHTMTIILCESRKSNTLFCSWVCFFFFFSTLWHGKRQRRYLQKSSKYNQSWTVCYCAIIQSFWICPSNHRLTTTA